MTRLLGAVKVSLRPLATVALSLTLACDSGIALPFASARSQPQSLEVFTPKPAAPTPLEPDGPCKAEMVLPEQRSGVRPRSGARLPWPPVREWESPLDSIWTDRRFLQVASQPITVDAPTAILFVPISMRLKRANRDPAGVNAFISQWRHIANVADSLELTLTPRANDGLRLRLSPYEWIDVVMPWQCYGVLTVWPDELPTVTFGPIAKDRIAEVLEARNFALLEHAL